MEQTTISVLQEKEENIVVQKSSEVEVYSLKKVLEEVRTKISTDELRFSACCSDSTASL